MRWLFSVFLIIPLMVINAQESRECFEIDFELVDEEVPFEGMIISNQYFDEFGLTFEREDGGFPVIAEVGPAEVNGVPNIGAAFGSQWGRDTPAPDVDVGRFFLTDDGMLSGSYSPPLILRFNNPIDSISGCNLDIDLEEEFFIEARDLNENIISTYVIRDGDPGTGDGALTCWGFNMQGCAEKIYSLRMEGFRPVPIFGLGVDNLSFCFSEQTDVQNSCLGNDGSVTVQAAEDGLQYSLDNLTYQESPTFTGLSPGVYIIYVRDQSNCLYTLTATVSTDTQFNIGDAIITNTNCLARVGSAEIVASNTVGNVTYAIDTPDRFQESNIFDNISEGVHTIYINDDEGCLIPFDIEVGITHCDIYVPNIFCPTCGVRENAEFSIATTNLYDICILKYEIYDRWGNYIYSAPKFSITDVGYWWDGTFDGSPAEIGVYVYVIEVIHEDGYTEVLSGDITLIR